MEVRVQTHFDIDDFISKDSISHLRFGDLVRKFAEKTSLWSDTHGSLELTLTDWSVLQHPSGCISTILALSFVRPGWSSQECSEKILTNIYNRARHNGFQGAWAIVGEVLQQDLYTRGVHGVLVRICKHYSVNDFYGNILKKTYRLVESGFTLRCLIFADEVATGRDRFRGVKRKIRRRGHNDKGSPQDSRTRNPNKYVTVSENEIRQAEGSNTLFSLQLAPPRYWYSSIYRGRPGRTFESERKEGIPRGSRKEKEQVIIRS
jgi:hypothetical protein